MEGNEKQYNIFFSWQSDISKNKNVIRKAIQIAIKKVKNIGKFVLIEDSRGKVGSVNIPVEIFNKIDNSNVFIADLTIINKELVKDNKDRLTPNPNILIEYGYARKTLGEQNILSLINKDICTQSELPFDIKTNSCMTFDINKPEDITNNLVNMITVLHQKSLLQYKVNQFERRPFFKIEFKCAKPEENDDKEYFSNIRYCYIYNDQINLKIKRDMFLEFENHYEKIDYNDVPLEYNITNDEIEEYNNALPDTKEIHKYVEEHN